MTFQKGQSGNPAGRPPGARGKAALIAEALFEGEAETIIRTAIEKAKEGDLAAVRLCLDRIVPRPRDRVVSFELPVLRSAESALAAVADIAAAVGRGDVTPGQADDLSKLVDRFLTTLECVELERRLTRLEEQTGIRPPRLPAPAAKAPADLPGETPPDGASAC
jgi:hypothetical protein